MNLWKILLIAFGLVILGMLAFPLISFVYNALWIVFWIALIGGGGYALYRFFTKNERKALPEGRDIYSIGEYDGLDREYQEIRRKYHLK